MSISAVNIFSFLLFLLSCVIFVQPVHSAEYYKCLDGKGKIYFSNVACPSQSQKSESKEFHEPSESEYQQSQREEEAAKKREKASQEAEAQLERVGERERLLTECLNEADERYQSRWDDTCLFGGGAKGCLLNSEIAAGYDRSHRGDRSECFKRHPH
jgi:hypothetical protein